MANATLRGWVSIGFAVCLAAPAGARPAYLKALAGYFGPLLPARLNDCRTCHADPASDEPKFNLSLAKPHNAFGARLMAVGVELARAGKRNDIGARLDAIAHEDSDGDGVSNLVELLTGHSPGSRKDRPTPAELARAPKLLAQLARQRQAYAWRPFDSVRCPAVPRIRGAAPLRNPIDAFVIAAQEKRGLKPLPEAPKNVLLRRVYLDLIGIPPTRQELAAFLADRSPDAYEKVVDRLLASPDYGARWGRHWMDVWRYSDWDGFGEEIRSSQRHIWRWRDWIVDSLNQDKGYDRMVQEMLAGDELAPGDPQVLPATGFLARNWYKFSRHEMLTKVVESTSKAFLGLTMNCARCHDHKYDPISQKEYFQFRAFFEPFDVRTDRVPGQPDLLKDGLPRVFDAAPAAETFVLIRGDDRHPDKSQPVTPGVPGSLGGVPLSIQPVTLPLTEVAPDERDFVIRETLAAGAEAVRAAQEKRKAAEAQVARAASAAGAAPAVSAQQGAARRALDRADLEVRVAEARDLALDATLRAEQALRAGPAPDRAVLLEATAAQRQQAVLDAELALAEAGDALVAAHANSSGTANKRPEAAAAAAAAEKKLAEAQQKLTEAQQKLADARKTAALPPDPNFTRRAEVRYPPTSTGRRLALARWITDRSNPLAARVAVNHIWLRHFGSPLVSTVFNFGNNGQPPTHPELLDWLAYQFMAPADPPAHQPQPTAHGSLPTAHPLLPTAHSSRPTAHDSLPTAHQPLPTAHGSRPTAHGSPPTASYGCNWSMKRLHRLIVTSDAYRRGSGEDVADQKKDPDNHYLWRMAPRRMEAEAVRDSLLAVAGQLDRASGGPDLDPNTAETNHRRSIYFRHSMEKQVPLLATFDQASPSECYRRDETIQPQQALALSNSALSREVARWLAAELWQLVSARPEALRQRDFLSAAFEQVLSREPSAAERRECSRFLASQAALLSTPAALSAFDAGAPSPVPPAQDPAQRAREDLIHVLLNHNDFVMIR